MAPFQVGLTGGIASGKSTVARVFEQQGITIIDADRVARDIVNPGLCAYQSIVSHFGDSVLQSDRTIDRKKLRSIIFKDPHEKKWLESLLHPLIRQEMMDLAATNTEPYLILMIPLLIESKDNYSINRVLVVDISEAEQRKRLLLRDACGIEDSDRIIKSQVSRAARLQAADDIIDNSGKPQDLESKVIQLHRYYLSLAQKTNASAANG